MHVLSHDWTDHANVSLNAEETRNLTLHFVESSPFNAGRMSIASVTRRDEIQSRENDLQVRLQAPIMGSYATPPNWTDESSDDDESRPRLGDLLSGRLADVAGDSVEAVRDERRRE
jgi:hypothetical protein